LKLYFIKKLKPNTMVNW